jgi:hypothetical protein
MLERLKIFSKKVELVPRLSAETEQEFLAKNSEVLDRFYAGKWVVAIADTVIADRSEYKLEMKARRLGVKSPLLVYIPREDEFPMIRSSSQKSVS